MDASLYETSESKMVAPVLLLATIALILSLIILNVYNQTAKNLPPGPKGLPIIGYLPYIGKNPHLTFMELRKKYGDIFTIPVAGTKVIVLASYNLIQKAFVGQADIFAGRPHYLAKLPTGFSTMNFGPAWTELRRFTVSSLKDLGVGKSSMEVKIQDEIQNYLIKSVEQNIGNPIQFDAMVKKSVTNVICIVIFGYRFDYENKVLKDLEILEELSKRMMFDNPGLHLPDFVNSIFGFVSPAVPMNKLGKHIKKAVEEHKSDKMKATRDSFIDKWLSEMERLRGKTTSINEKNLLKTLLDLFIAGSDTSAVTLVWTFLYLIKHPEIQTKVQEEIDTIIGRDRVPSVTDLKSMPYTEATLMEITRVVTIAPIGLPHCTTKDTSLNGYFIPKSTTVVSCLWCVHYNEEVFPEPERFKPERFLDENYQNQRKEQVIPFSLGKRKCIAEQFGKLEIFLFVTSLLQRFTFKAVEGTSINLECKYGALLEPNHQKIVAVNRE